MFEVLHDWISILSDSQFLARNGTTSSRNYPFLVNFSMFYIVELHSFSLSLLLVFILRTSCHVHSHCLFVSTYT